MSEESTSKTDKKIQDLEKRFEVLNEYLSKNGEIVIDLVMRIAALEKILMSKNIFSEEEIQAEVKKTYETLAKKAKDSLEVGDNNGN